MAALARRHRRSLDIWPGFVDALATLLMVIIFLLMVFVLAQFFLTETLSGRDAALRRLEGQVSELASLLALERKASVDLGAELSRLQAELKASIAERSQLSARLQASEAKLDQATTALAEAATATAADRATIERQARELTSLASDIAALKALKAELEKEAAALVGKAKDQESALIEERKLSESARAQIALLNQQLAALRDQIERLNAALDASEQKAKDQEVQIVNLGQRLNAALASKVAELARYRSEFFGRLREILGDQAGVRIVGDRFVFASEVLFAPGSAALEDSGRAQILKVAALLKDIAQKIPDNIDWLLQIEGHTDKIPINTAPFPSNWELSTARAISVLRLLMEAGLPPSRLSAAGFGEYHPIDAGNDETAFRRNRRIELKLTQR